MKRALCLSILVLLSSCNKEEKPLKVSAQEAAVAVSAIQVENECLTQTLRLHGEIKAADQVVVYPKVSGKLIAYQVKSGQEVEKGELIATIDRDEVGFQYNQAPVYSPISGVVSSLSLNDGENAQPSAPIASIMNVDSVNGVFTVPERYRSSVKEGQQIEIVLDSLKEELFTATVSDVNPLIDPSSHAFTIKAQLDNPHKQLIPGMFAIGDLVLNTFEKSILVPEEAVLPRHGEWFIYVVANGEALQKRVEVGMRKEGKIQLRSGVEPGDLVIVGGNHKLSEGQKVREQL